MQSAPVPTRNIIVRNFLEKETREHVEGVKEETERETEETEEDGEISEFDSNFLIRTEETETIQEDSEKEEETAKEEESEKEFTSSDSEEFVLAIHGHIGQEFLDLLAISLKKRQIFHVPLHLSFQTKISGN